MTFLYAYGLLSLGASFGFVAGAIMTSGKRADEDMAAPQRRSTIIGPRGCNSKPHLVLISPTEMREVKTGARP
jgi:hypothetical protein